MESNPLNASSRFDLMLEELRQSLQTKDRAELASQLQQIVNLTRDFEPDPNQFRLLADIFMDLDAYSRAIRYYEKSLAGHDPETCEFALLLNQIGICHKNTGEYSLALEYFLKAFNAFEQLGDNEKRAGVQINIGHVNLTLTRFDDALIHYKEALETWGGEGSDSEEAVMIFNAISNVYRHQEAYAKSMEYAQKALRICESQNMPERQMHSLNSMGLIYSKMGDFPSALDTYTRGLERSRILKDRRMEAVFLSNIGYMHARMEDPETALRYINQSLPIAQETSAFKHLMDLQKMLFFIHYSMSDRDGMRDAYETYNQLRDKLFHQETRQRIDNLETRFDLERKEKEAEIYRLKNVELKDALDKLQKAYLQQEEDHAEILRLEKKNSALAMAVTANHELKQPLMVLSGNLEMFHATLDEDSLSDAQRKMLLRMNESMSRIKQILEHYAELSDLDFTDYAGSGSVKMVQYQKGKHEKEDT